MKETIKIYVYAAKHFKSDRYQVFASTVNMLESSFYDIQVIDTIEYEANINPSQLEDNRKQNEKQDLLDKQARLQAELDELNSKLGN